MAKKIEDFRVDLRALKLNISRGNITKQEYQEHLKSLPDLSKKCDEIPAYTEPDEEAGDQPEDLTFSAA